MTATNETYLPTYEDLYVPPLNLTSPALRAGAIYFAQYCDVQSKVNVTRNKLLSSSFYLYYVKRSLCFAKLKRIKTLENVLNTIKS